MDNDLLLPPLLAFGPTVIAGALAAVAALNNRRPWGAFLTGFLGTIALAVGLGLVVDLLDRSGFSLFPCWLFQGVVSPLPAASVGAFCAARVEKRNRRASGSPVPWWTIPPVKGPSG